MNTFQLIFKVSGQVRQQIQDIAEGLTPENILAGLKSGKYLISNIESGVVYDPAAKAPVAKVSCIAGTDVDYHSFEIA